MRHTTAGNANYINPRSFWFLVLPNEEIGQGQSFKEYRKGHETKS